ncbi:hypothetical protein V9T40_003728 [Parthenolecanium corni]|uniref:Protein male-specific lethal-3 n=1 Tax=Parthenolecanium corni TaxID=536013 RepID=A0AAN9TR62_9HEMI
MYAEVSNFCSNYSLPDFIRCEIFSHRRKSNFLSVSLRSSRNTQRRQISKRHGKSKFSEGEVVLCYEPDPAKTKVLYSSKVVQIVEKYDDNDKIYEEYLIHFHGWNSTWDRYVTEDFILKDTPENRKLQQKLAHEAQLTPGGNLYKRDLRNRRRSSSSRRRSRNSESAFHTNAQRSSNDEEGISQGETTQDEYSSDKSSDDEGMYISLKEIPPAPVIRIPAVLKKALGYDEYLITVEKKLLRLPAEPSIVTVLETFVHHYVTHGLRSYISKQTRRLKYEDLVARVSLCKEMVDGLRIIFDFTVDNLLMYQEERPQFHDICNISLNPPVRSFSCVLENELKELENNASREIKIIDGAPLANESKNSCMAKRVLRSQHHQQNTEIAESSSQTPERSEKPEKSDRAADKTERYEKNENVVPVKKEEIQNSMASSSCSSNGVVPPYNLRFDGSIIYNRHIKKLVQREIQDWKLIPDSLYSQKPLKPTLIYGATHFARLFVKLPEILQYSAHKPEMKDIIVEYSEILLNFLAEHLEWFGISHYVSDDFEDVR